MLSVFHSNDLKTLACLLAETIYRSEDIDNKHSYEVLLPETVLVQSHGMGRWLKLKLAEIFGISANIRCILPASFIWEVVRKIAKDAPEVSPFDREVLRWRLVRLLPELIKIPCYTSIASYIAHDTNGRKLYQLADQISRVFDSYLVYRPEWIKAWEQNNDDNAPEDLLWQSQLWRDLVQDSKAHYQDQLNHRVEIYESLKVALKQNSVDIHDLPSRVSVFGTSSMPPENLDLLNLLARHIDIQFFVLNPCEHYWGDLIDEKRMHSQRIRAIASGTHFDHLHYTLGNPLLASMGKIGKEFVDLLLECNIHAEANHFVQQEIDSILHLVQHDILELEDSSKTQPEEAIKLFEQVVSGIDNSLTIQICHSPLREVQVLHDQLLAMFETLPELTPRDIIVMTPNIDNYAPYVEAVFSAASESNCYIPWALADLNRLERHPLCTILMQVLDLPDSHATSSQLLGILRQDGVCRKFNLEESDIAIIVEWVKRSGIRWGLENNIDSNISNETSQITCIDKNTWDFGLRRLLAGYACSNESSIVFGILPCGIYNSGQALALGKLAEFLEVLKDLRNYVNSEHTFASWQSLLPEITKVLYELDENDSEAHRELSRLFTKFAKETEIALLKEPIHRTVLKEHLLASLGGENVHQRFLGGEVTFCNLLPMRSVPFRVICLLGMNDGDFPRIQERQSFDLMSRTPPKRGDRSKRDDDRYLFLEAILSAGERLYISYVGRDPRDNSLMLPSALVSELCEYIEASLSTIEAEKNQLQEALITKHPLQPFSSSYFSQHNKSKLFSYNSQWLPTRLQKLYAQVSVDQELESSHTIDLTDLTDFYKNPCKYYFNQTLRVYFSRDKDTEDTEPFPNDYLERWTLQRTIVKEQLAGGSISKLRELQKLSGKLPISPFDEVVFHDAIVDTSNLVAAVQANKSENITHMHLQIKLAKATIEGVVSSITPYGLVDYVISNCSMKYVFPIWVKHLCLAASGNLLKPTKLFCKDGFYTIAPLEVEDATNILSVLVENYITGRHKPIAFFPVTSTAVAKYLVERNALNFGRMLNAFNGAITPGEASDPYIKRAYREDDLFRAEGQIHAELEDLARKIMQPIFQYLEQEKYVNIN